jgi:putative peptidoglycan lipid II flippase
MTGTEGRLPSDRGLRGGHQPTYGNAPFSSFFDEKTVLLPELGIPGQVAAIDDVTAELPMFQGTPTRGDTERPEEAAASGRADVKPDADGNSLARNSAVMAFGSIVSRFSGLLRNSVLVAAVGHAVVGDVYTVANTLPNMVYELLLGGVLGSVIIPSMMRARTYDRDRGEAYAQRLLTLATVLLGAATVLAACCAPLLSRLFSGSHSSAASEHLRTELTALLLPQIFFYGIAALISAVLNTRGHFTAPMWTPILNNGVVIATCIVFMVLPSPHDRTLGPLSVAQVLVLGVGTTLGVVVQAVGLVPALRRVQFRWRWRWDWNRLNLAELARMSGWMLCYVALSQVGVIVVFKLAQSAADKGGFGPIVFNNGYLVFMMAHGIAAVSIMTALMPKMAAAAAEGRFAHLAGQLSLGTRLSSVILLPATAAYLALGRPLAVMLFGYGAYRNAAVDTGFVIAIAGLGLIPFAISQMQIFAFYAMSDTRTPALLNVPVVLVRCVADVALYLVLAPAAVAAGLMAGNGVSYVLSVAVGYWLLRRRIGRLGLSVVLTTVARLALAAAAAAIPTWLTAVGIRHVLGDGRGSSMLQLVLGGGVLLIGYVGLALLLRVREIRELADTIARRIGR